MNHRRIAAATAAVWLVSIPLGALIHHGVLGSVHAANAAVFRPDADVVQRLPIGYAVQISGFWAAAVMYAETSPRSSSILGGIRFGLFVGVIVVSLAVVWNYVTQPISIVVGVTEAFEYMFLCAVCGAIIGVIWGHCTRSPTFHQVGRGAGKHNGVRRGLKPKAAQT